MNFSLASFDDRVDFTGARFRFADFSDARFRGEASFADVTGDGNCRFDGADFAGLASFHRALFDSTVTFVRAEFHRRADFRLAVFDGPADFAVASFTDATFATARFAARPRPPREPGLILAEVDASGSLDFSSAEFVGPIDAFGMTADALVLNPHQAANHVFGPQVSDVLELIESSAKDKQNFSLANDAFYERQIILSHHYSAVQRALDVVFYRTVAGYLVRPQRPLLILVVLVWALAVIRTLRARRPYRLRSMPALSRDLFQRAERSFLTAFRWRSEIPTGMNRLEVFTYRLLLICALIGLYADPTFRQIFEFLRG